jgi:hypothetical protein
MRKLFFLIFFLFILSYSFAQEITATQKFPDTAIPGGDYIVEITINRTGITGFMKFFQGVPSGCIAKEIESKGGKFSFDDGGAKVIWITPPAEDQFIISYQVVIPKEVLGTKNINGKIAYLSNSERKIYDLETKTIKIGDPLATPTTETILVTGSDRTIITSSPILKPKDEDPAPSKTIADTPTTTIPVIPEKEITPVAEEPVKKEEPVVSISTPVVIKKEEEKIPVKEPVKKEEKKTVPVNLPVSPNTPITAIPSSVGKTFRVQIGAFTLKPAIKGVPEPSTVVLENGVTKYFSGNFVTYEEAAKRKKEMIEKGFSGAFVVSFENGKIVK